MLCDDAQKKLPDLLNDLLSEENRIGIRDHLSVCPACQEHVLRLSSFAGDLKRLAVHSSIPFDLAGALMIRLKVEDRKEKVRDWRLIALTVAITAAIVFFITHEGRFSVHLPAAPKISLQEKKNDSYLETLRELESIETRLRRVAEDKPSAGDSASTDRASPAASAITLLPFHWHIRAENSERYDFFLRQVKKLQANELYESRDLLILSMKLPVLKALTDIAGVSSGIKSDSPLPDVQELPQTTLPVIVSMSFLVEDRKAQSYHWHLKFELKNAYIFQQGMKDLGFTFRYESDDLWVLDLDAAQFEMLKTELHSFPGLYWNSKSTYEQGVDHSAISGRVNVSICVESH